MDIQTRLHRNVAEMICHALGVKSASFNKAWPVDARDSGSEQYEIDAEMLETIKKVHGIK